MNIETAIDLAIKDLAQEPAITAAAVAERARQILNRPVDLAELKHVAGERLGQMFDPLDETPEETEARLRAEHPNASDDEIVELLRQEATALLRHAKALEAGG